METNKNIQALVDKANAQRQQAYENQAIGLLVAIQSQLDWVKNQAMNCRQQAEANIANYRKQLADLRPPTPITVDEILWP
jgi:hypothetical protein